MSSLPASLLVPIAPQVNLIPPEVASRKAQGRARGLIMLGLVGFVAILLGIFYLTGAQQRAAQADLDAAVKAGDDLNAQIAKYSEVPLVQAQLLNATSARLYAGATEIRWEDLLRRMREVMPTDVGISTATFAASSPIAPVTPLAGPFAAPGVGIVSFSGSSLSYPEVADIERAIDSVAGLTDAQIPAVTRVIGTTGVKYTFSGTATITAQALDFRFTDAWFVARDHELADEYLDALVGETSFEVLIARALSEGGLPGAAAALSDALERQGVVSAARETYTSLSEVFATAQSNLVIATAAQANGEKGSDALLASAQAAVDTLTPAMDQMTAAVLAARDSSRALDTASTRVAAAESLVAEKKASLDSAKAALAAAEAAPATPVKDLMDLQEDVSYREVLVSEAEDVLKAEQAAHVTAQAAADVAFKALAPATAAAETAITKANVTVALKPNPDAPAPVVTTPNPSTSPSPGASPTASATSGSDS